MRRMLPILILLILASPSTTFALIPLESPIATGDAESRILLDRLKNVLALTEKRMKEVFGIVPEAVAVAAPSRDAYDFLLTSPGASPKGGKAAVLMINTRVVRDYDQEDLQIAAARSLYQVVWPKFRKAYTKDRELVARLYTEGMTAYAAELIVPRSAAWKYAGLFVKEGKELYGRYLAGEQGFAAAVHQAVMTGTEGNCPADLCPKPSANGLLLSYRIMKTFEKEMDPKMIQLMDFAEFRDRLPRALEVLQKGYAMKGDPVSDGVRK
jgi:hypothetical protein